MSKGERKTASVLVRMTMADRQRLDAYCRSLPMVAQKRGPMRHPTAPEVMLDLLRKCLEDEKDEGKKIHAD